MKTANIPFNDGTSLEITLDLGPPRRLYFSYVRVFGNDDNPTVDVLFSVESIEEKTDA